MVETELKFQVPAAARRAVERAVATSAAQRTRLQAVYVDTPDRALAAAGVALRLRKEGRRWVQTLKAGGHHAMQRLEHNVPVVAGRGIPTVDPARHDGHPAGERLRAVLAEAQGGLVEQYRTDIWRWHRVAPVRGGAVELAYDQGEIVARDRRWPVSELEIELVRGAPHLVADVARRWVSRHGLWWDVRSKAERGTRLAMGLDRVPARKAGALDWPSGDGAPASMEAVLRGVLAHLLPNLDEVAGGEHIDEHLHQVRVALRRLRSALRLFEGWGPDARLVAPLATAFSALGEARDADALAAWLMPALQAAGGPAPIGPGPVQPAVDPGTVLRDPALTNTLLMLQGWLVGGPWPAVEGPVAEGSLGEAVERPTSPAADTPWREQLGERLARWHRRLRRGSKDPATLDDEALHRVRRQVKRLRYAGEFVGTLYDRKATRRFLKQVEALQEHLGAWHDAQMAWVHYQQAPVDDPHTWFARGWLGARVGPLRAEAEAALRRFRRAKPFWG